MSWHDPDRSQEPDSETALRNELRGLLGMPSPASSYFEVEPSPELILLADDLRREAQRRSRTQHRRSSWVMPLAAALPFALALGGAGVWGVAQKHKADTLAAAVVHQEAEIQRLAANQAPEPSSGPVQPVRVHRPAARNQAPQVFLVGSARPKDKPKELVIPVERSADPSENDTQRVKAH